MDSIDDYAKALAKREEVEWDNLSEWVKQLGRIHKLKNYVNDRPISVFRDTEAVNCLSSLHDKYVVVLADTTSINIIFECKSYHFKCLVKDKKYMNTQVIAHTKTHHLTKGISANHKSLMASMDITLNTKLGD